MELVTEILGRIESLREYAEYRHEYCVSVVAARIARLMGIDEKRSAAIGRAALLHDIGKLVLPEAVLHKPVGLSMPESEMTRLHCKLGHDILKEGCCPDLDLAATVALRHHEYVDGTGYPDGLKGGEIPLEVRTVTVADIYAALREPRAYKPELSHEAALAILTQGDGKVRPEQLDADVLKAVETHPEEIEQAYSAAF